MRRPLRSGTQAGIVEGEPGIFPDPIARFMRFIANLFRRKKPPPPPPPDKPEPPATMGGT